MSIDLRSLALLRIILGLLLLTQSIDLSRDFDSFYRVGAAGPLHAASDLLLRAILFLVLPLLGVMLILGFLTRISLLLSFLSLVVVQEANPQILQGGDVLLRLLVFWSLFLPLGQIWSIDLICRKTPFIILPQTTFFATLAFTFQICFVYWFASLLKTSPLWTQNGNALYYALSIEHFTSLFGLYMRQYPDFLRVLTWITPWLELFGPCLLLIPVYRDACRLAAITLFIGFHLIGMQLVLRIGLFPWVCAAAWLAFLPPCFWDCPMIDKITSLLFKKPLAARKKNIPSRRNWHPIDSGCTVLAIVCFLDILAWNFASVRGNESMRWMQEHDGFGRSLGLEQQWNMYAPFPRSEHGWLVIPADLADGSEVDLFSGQSVTWEKPKDIGAYFGDDRWRRYLSNLFDNRDPQQLQAYANYLVAKWNDSHELNQRIQAVTIIFMKQTTQPDLTITPAEKEPIYFAAF